MSVCLHLSLRPTFWMDAAGFEPEGGGYRLEMKNHLQPNGPETSAAWESSELYPVSQQYIAKANRTPASKLMSEMNEWMNEWMNGWMDEWLKEGMN